MKWVPLGLEALKVTRGFTIIYVVPIIDWMNLQIQRYLSEFFFLFYFSFFDRGQAEEDIYYYSKFLQLHDVASKKKPSEWVWSADRP